MCTSHQGLNMPILYSDNRKVNNSPSRKRAGYTKCYTLQLAMCFYNPSQKMPLYSSFVVLFTFRMLKLHWSSSEARYMCQLAASGACAGVAGKGIIWRSLCRTDLLKSLLQPGDLKSRRLESLTMCLACFSATVSRHSCQTQRYSTVLKGLPASCLLSMKTTNLPQGTNWASFWGVSLLHWLFSEPPPSTRWQKLCRKYAVLTSWFKQSPLT